MNDPEAAKLIGRGWAFPPQIGHYRGITLTTTEDEIDQAIYIILHTIPGERVMRPTFGSRLHELLFAPMNTETLALAQRFVEEAITMWEPRVRIINLAVRPGEGAHDGALLIAMHYEIKTTRDQRSLVYPFYLIPEE